MQQPGERMAQSQHVRHCLGVAQHVICAVMCCVVLCAVRALQLGLSAVPRVDPRVPRSLEQYATIYREW